MGAFAFSTVAAPGAPRCNSLASVGGRSGNASSTVCGPGSYGLTMRRVGKQERGDPAVGHTHGGHGVQRAGQLAWLTLSSIEPEDRDRKDVEQVRDDDDDVHDHGRAQFDAQARDLLEDSLRSILSMWWIAAQEKAPEMVSAIRRFKVE